MEQIFRPILFNTEMVQATLDDRKNQTRRMKKLDTFNSSPNWWRYDGLDVEDSNTHYFEALSHQKEPLEQYKDILCPYGKKGDILWVRETFEIVPVQTAPVNAFKSEIEMKVNYKADQAEAFNKWKPSIFMPKEACRIFLEITDISIERLQDISHEDAIGEGIEKYGPFDEYKGSLHPNGGKMRYRAYGSPIRAFQDLWTTINGSDSWNKNPWVWVIKFKRINKPAGFLKI